MVMKALTLRNTWVNLKVLNFLGTLPKSMKRTGLTKAIGLAASIVFFGGGVAFPAQPDPAAQTAYDQRDYQTAVLILESQVAKTPNDFEVLTLLGSSYRKLGDYARAEPLLKKALSQKPKTLLFF